MAENPWRLLGPCCPVSKEDLQELLQKPVDSTRVHSPLAVHTLLDEWQEAFFVGLGIPAGIYRGQEAGATMSTILDPMLFASRARANCLALAPIILCPSCSQPVADLAAGRLVYRLPPGLFPTGQPGPACPFPELLRRMQFTVEPCSCRLSHEWVAAFTQEVNRRMAGETPAVVTEMSLTERSGQYDRLRTQLDQLYTALDAAQTLEGRQRVQCYLVIAYDRLRQLNRGVYAPIRSVELDPEVRFWAEKEGLALPPAPAVSQPSTQVTADPGWGYPSDYPLPVLNKTPGSKTLLGPASPQPVTAEQTRKSITAILEMTTTQKDICLAVLRQYVSPHLSQRDVALTLGAIQKSLSGYLGRGTPLSSTALDFVASLQLFLVTAQSLSLAPSPAPDTGASTRLIDRLLERPGRRVIDIDLD